MLKTSLELIGDCAFQVSEEDGQQAKIGYTLARPYQGSGYATEAVTGLLNYLFGDVKLHRVIALCDVRLRPPSACWSVSGCGGKDTIWRVSGLRASGVVKVGTLFYRESGSGCTIGNRLKKPVRR